MKKKKFILSEIFSFIFIIIGSIGSFLAPLAVCIVCVAPEVYLVLSIISFVIGLANNYNYLFISIGLTLLVLTIYASRRKECIIKKK